jgi:hypothetical protein
MPSPLAQNRDQRLARQAQITAQNSIQFFQSRQDSQAAVESSRLNQDQLTSAHRKDSFVQQKHQTMNAQLLLTAATRIASNEAQANKTVANQQDLAAYLSAQAERKFINAPMTLGYA